MKLGYRLIHPLATAPKFANPGGACFDVASAEALYLVPGCVHKVHTGLKFDIPEGYELRMYSRSGHGMKGISLANSVGVIDSGYTGELIVLLRNESREAFHVRVGDRIAQAQLKRLEQYDLVQIEAITKTTERGDGGFGSTGVKS